MLYYEGIERIVVKDVPIPKSVIRRLIGRRIRRK